VASPLVALDIRSYLVNTTGLTDVTINQMSPTPINQYAVIEYAGLPAVKVHGTGNPKVPALDETNVQILARHTSAQTARTNMRTVVDALDGLSDVTINSVVYTYIEVIGKPRIHERAEDGSITFLAEFRVQSRR
jgi:hypothetical protein